MEISPFQFLIIFDLEFKLVDRKNEFHPPLFFKNPQMVDQFHLHHHQFLL